MRIWLSSIAVFALGTGVAMAAQPALFGQSQPGLWELSGVQGAKTPARICVADLSQLALVEHRGRGCRQKLLRETGSSATFTYECSTKDFGRSEISFVTPRNFKILSQGIADGLPFSHTVQARRLGDCQPKAAPSRH